MIYLFAFLYILKIALPRLALVSAVLSQWPRDPSSAAVPCVYSMLSSLALDLSLYMPFYGVSREGCGAHEPMW